MRTILLATDFSAAAKNATDYAAQLAKKANATLILLHVYMLPTPVSEMPYIMVSVDEMQKDNELAAQKEAERVFNKFNIKAETIVKIGVPSDELLDVAEEKKADLIVMGMKGTGNALDKFIGSTTTSVIRKSHKPVLVIPHTASFTAISEIVYATDYSYEIKYSSFDALKRIANLFFAKVSLLHIQKPGEAVNVNEMEGKKRMENLLEHNSHQFYSVENELVENGIKAFLVEHPAQMLVMVSHRHSFFERLFGVVHTKEMLYQTNIPLLVLENKD